MRQRRMLAAVIVLVTTMVGVRPTAAGPPPATFNEMFTSYPMTVNGSYTPVVGDFDCFDVGMADFSILWYAPGPAPDFQWRDFDTTPSGLEHSSVPRSVNGTYEPFVGDFDDNGCDDIFWYGPGSAADFVWYAVPGRAFTVRAVTMAATRTPVVGTFDDTDGDDIFWYGEGGGTESYWLGNPTLGTFTSHSAPQVGGTDFITVGSGGGILFYRPGTGADYFWNGIDAAQPRPAKDTRITINGRYRPIRAGGVLLYGPGPAVDVFISSIRLDGTLDTVPGAINGVYRTAAGPPGSFPVVVFHAPGPAPDYLWAPSPT